MIKKDTKIINLGIFFYDFLYLFYYNNYSDTIYLYNDE